MTYALLSMSERHGLLAGIMCAGASPVPACAELTQPPAWFFAAVARPCLWAVGRWECSCRRTWQPQPFAASPGAAAVAAASADGARRAADRWRPSSCRGGGHVGGPAGKARRPEARHSSKMASCFLIYIAE